MKTFQGLVISLKNKNTAVVRVSSFKSHDKYKKVVESFKKFQVHFGSEVSLKLGQKVIVKQSRPFSATKRFTVVIEN